jgi:phosphate transport system permease protein
VTTTSAQRPPDVLPQARDLQQPSLSRTALAGLAVVVLLVTSGLFAVTDLAGRAGFVVVATLLYVAAQTAVSRVVEGGRRSVDRLVTTAVIASFLIALAPLISVLLYTAEQGLTRFDWDFFYRSLRSIGARDPGGGANHAIVGTLQQVGLATLMSVPLGLLVAIYIVEYGRGRLAATIRFFVDVMTGIPSIVAGLFVLSFWILGLGFGYSGFAAALALTVLMLPVIVRSAEEMLKLVPNDLREASLALGVPRWRTILSIVLPTALPGVVTGIMLAVARVMGETAPVLLTAFGTASIVRSPFEGPQSSLPLFIYQEAASPQGTAISRAWTAALTLILVIMVLNLLARLVTRRSTLKK